MCRTSLILKRAAGGLLFKTRSTAARRRQWPILRRWPNYSRAFPVSTPQPDYGTSRRADFWFIVAARSEDEAEIRVGQSAGRASSEGHSASDPPAVFGGREDPHRAGRAAR